MNENSIQLGSHELGSHQLAYTSLGRENSPPLILLHGWMSHRNVWDPTMEVLKLSHRCIAVDLLGFGASPKPANGNYSIPAQARRILQLANALDFRQFELIGHSMGAQIALYLAAKLAPDRVNKLVSVAGVVSGRLARGVEGVVIPMVTLGARLPFLYDLARRLSRSRLFAALLFQPWFHSMSALSYSAWETDREMACQRTIHKSAYKASRAMSALDLTPDLPAIETPTLAIHGQQDRAVPVSEGQLIQAYVPGSHLRLIERCGHYPMYEQRDRYMDYLLAFLRQDSLDR